MMPKSPIDILKDQGIITGLTLSRHVVKINNPQWSVRVKVSNLPFTEVTFLVNEIDDIFNELSKWIKRWKENRTRTYERELHDLSGIEHLQSKAVIA
jgi:hypothetical protein